MEFKKVFRGYDPSQVDKYISETADKEAMIRRSQRERISELSDENYTLRERLAELQRKQNDIADALIASQNFAKETELDAMQYADKVLFQAKKFYATWQAYSQTIVASFTDDELKAFNDLERKLENVILSYEKQQKKSKSNGKASVNAAATDVQTEDKTTAEAEAVPEQPATVNPIAKVEAAAGYAIDLRELTQTDQTLEELCADLGLISK